jgi:hypothetical protein
LTLTDTLVWWILSSLLCTYHKRAICVSFTYVMWLLSLWFTKQLPYVIIFNYLVFKNISTLNSLMDKNVLF